MKVSLSDVKETFRKLISQEISREDANDWAYALVKKRELGELKFEPRKDEKEIWKGIMYLYGVDMQNAPSEYFHSFDDIRADFEELYSE